jgi:hypothetical protein
MLLLPLLLQRSCAPQLRRIESHWRRTELQLAKYQKGGVDRSYVLRAADEIKLELEDHMLNLQVLVAKHFQNFMVVVLQTSLRHMHMHCTIMYLWRFQIATHMLAVATNY